MQNNPKNLVPSTLEIRAKIQAAIDRQHNRYQDPYIYNGSLSSAKAATLLTLDSAAERLLRSAAENLNLSARSFYKTLKVAQTIADLDNKPLILSEHISEALSFRLDQIQNSLIIK